ncbi:MAG: phosphohistidine phosphatase SixA [Limisphaerales bacterium]
MNLYFLRHGIAVDPSVPDFANDADRPLTAKGKRRLRQIADAMGALRISFDVILSSPYVRAKQTAEIVAKSLKRKKKLKFSDELTPRRESQGIDPAIERFATQTRKIFCSLATEPYLGKLIALLAAGNTNMELDFKKGGLCKLESESAALRTLRNPGLASHPAPHDVDKPTCGTLTRKCMTRSRANQSCQIGKR